MDKIGPATRPFPQQPKLAPQKPTPQLKATRLSPGPTRGPKHYAGLMPADAPKPPPWLPKPSAMSRLWGGLKSSLARGAAAVGVVGGFLATAVSRNFWAVYGPTFLSTWSSVAALLPPWLAPFFGPATFAVALSITAITLISRALSSVKNVGAKVVHVGAACVQKVGRGVRVAGGAVKQGATVAGKKIAQAATAVFGGDVGREVVRLVKNVGRGARFVAVSSVKGVNVILEWLGKAVLFVAGLPKRLIAACARAWRRPQSGQSSSSMGNN